MSWTWTGFEVRAAARLCEALYPSGVAEDLAVGAADVGMDAFVPRLVDMLPHSSALLLRLAVWVVLLSPPLLGLGARTFLGLDVTGRDRAVSRLADHRFYLVRELTMLWKAFAGMGYAGDPRVRAALGIAPAADPPGLPSVSDPVALGRGEGR